MSDDGLRRYLRLGADDFIDMPPTGGEVKMWQCPHCEGRLREHYPREPKFGDRGVCGYCNEIMDMGHGGPLKDGKLGVIIMRLPSGEDVVGFRESADVSRRWSTGEQIFPTGFAVLPFFELWRGSYDDRCPDLITLKQFFPDMAALAEWFGASRQ